MKRCLTFVLGGGGALGALQVGALRALLEAGILPDMLVGTSIGAVNAAGLGLWGADLAGTEALARVYQEVANANFLDRHVTRLTLRAALGRTNPQSRRRLAEFFISKGITPDLRFGQIRDVRLALIGADLDTGEPVIYGYDPGDSVLEGVLASVAIPPWFAPIEKSGHSVVDGGVLSNLPIEPALIMRATEIIALDLADTRIIPPSDRPVQHHFGRLAFAIGRRQRALEMAIARAQGVPVHCINLLGPAATPIWDFSNFQQLIETGYEIATLSIPDLVRTSQTKILLPDLRARRQPASVMAPSRMALSSGDFRDL